MSAFHVIFTHEVASVNFSRPNLAHLFPANSPVKFCVPVCVCARMCISTELHLKPKGFLWPETPEECRQHVTRVSLMTKSVSISKNNQPLWAGTRLNLSKMHGSPQNLCKEVTEHPQKGNLHALLHRKTTPSTARLSSKPYIFFQGLRDSEAHSFRGWVQMADRKQQFVSWY